MHLFPHLYTCMYLVWILRRVLLMKSQEKRASFYADVVMYKNRPDGKTHVPERKLWDKGKLSTQMVGWWSQSDASHTSNFTLHQKLTRSIDPCNHKHGNRQFNITNFVSCNYSIVTFQFERQKQNKILNHSLNILLTPAPHHITHLRSTQTV